MYLWLKLQRESYEYWKQHFNSPDTPWTAEWMIGWKLQHRPWLFLLAIGEGMLESLAVIYLCVIFSR